MIATAIFPAKMADFLSFMRGKALLFDSAIRRKKNWTTTRKPLFTTRLFVCGPTYNRSHWHVLEHVL